MKYKNAKKICFMENDITQIVNFGKIFPSVEILLLSTNNLMQIAIPLANLDPNARSWKPYRNCIWKVIASPRSAHKFPNYNTSLSSAWKKINAFNPCLRASLPAKICKPLPWPGAKRYRVSLIASVPAKVSNTLRFWDARS